MPGRIKRPFTIRITAAEVLESQLDIEDLKALAPGREAGVLCPGVYCSGGYSDEAEEFAAK